MANGELSEKLRADGIRLLELWYVDMVGRVKAVVAPVSAQESIAILEREGLACDVGSLYPDWRNTFQDMFLKPDIESYLTLPWTQSKSPLIEEIDAAVTARTGRARKHSQQPRIPTARVFCSLESKGAITPFSARDQLKTVLSKCHQEHGWQYMVGPELEFHYFDKQGRVVDGKSYLEVEGDGKLSEDLRYLTALACETVGIGVECHHHEVGHGQQEIDFVKDDALSMADKVVTYKALVREIATMLGVSASFMPKPVDDSHGNGMHVHQSLWKNGQNDFYGEKEELKLSQTGRLFAAGLLAHAQEITAITNQWVNSYKRLVPGFEAPVYIAWAPANRSTLIRIPRSIPGQSDSVRIEYRSPDPACNPYLAFTALLAAGLEGIRLGVGLPYPIKENIYHMPEIEIRQRSIGLLPTTLEEALKELEHSALMRGTFGENFIEEYIASKRDEWRRFNAHVTDVEIADLRRHGL